MESVSIMLGEYMYSLYSSWDFGADIAIRGALELRVEQCVRIVRMEVSSCFLSTVIKIIKFVLKEVIPEDVMSAFDILNTSSGSCRTFI